MNKHQRELLEQIQKEREMPSSDQKLTPEPEYTPIASENKEEIAKEAPCYGTPIAEGKHEFAGNECMLCGLKRGGWFSKAEPEMKQFGDE